MKTFTLELTDKEVDIIGNALSNMPFKDVVALITKLQSQINEQLKSADTANIGTN